MQSKLNHKFKAIRSEYNNIKFSSTKERNRYINLEFYKNQGEILFFLRQVPFHLPGNIKYVCDFMVFWKDGSVTIEDVKGFKTQMYKTKKKIVESIYPITIQEI